MADPRRPVAELCTLGETMGLFTASEVGPLRNGAPATIGIGGAESNVAIGVRRLGHSAEWISRVGADPLGALILRELRAEGVDIDHVRVDPEAPTGIMIKVRRTAASSDVRYLRAGSAASRLSPEDLPENFLAGARILHLTGITPGLSASARAAAEKAVGEAKRCGVTVSFDVNYRARVWKNVDPAPCLREFVAAADVVFASEHEAALLVGEGEPATSAARLATLGPRTVVIKRGEQGCLASVDGEIFAEPALRVPVVDTVGAGDAFVAGFLVGWLEGRPVPEILTLANLCGAFAVAAPGDWEGLPTRAELDEFRSRRDIVSR